MLLGKRLDQWTEQDLHVLVQNQVSESRQLDYKQELKLKTDKDKRDFLADVCAMANTAGGYLIFGVEEDDGIPTAIPGLENFNPDEDIRRIESLVQSSINPRLVPGLEPKDIKLSNGRYALILYVPRSWAGPHAVTFGGTFRVYGRGDKQNFLMDMQQLRQAILQSALFEQQLRDFRRERLALIQTRRELPAPLVDDPLLVVHCAPAGAWSPGSFLDVVAAERDGNLLQLLNASVSRFNLDGFVRHPQLSSHGRVSYYLQVFRSGIIEHVRSLIPENAGEFSFVDIEERVITTSRHALPALKTLGAAAPVWIMVSLIGLKGAKLVSQSTGLSGYEENYGGFVDRDPLVLPEIMVDDFDADLDQTLRPLFDMLWQSAGYPQCLHYDKDGRWNPPR